MLDKEESSRFDAIRRKNRLVAAAPWLSRVSEIVELVKAASRWRREGLFVPIPYALRRAMLLTHSRKISAEIFVETGTYKGGTTWSLLHEFRRIITIEVVPELATLAQERFRDHKKVTVIEGDSATALPEICTGLDAPSLFFLDGHYSGGITGMGSGECPVVEELHAVFKNTKVPFRIIIDDAREFGSDPAYPKIRDVAEIVRGYRPQMQVRIENDAIIIYEE